MSETAMNLLALPIDTPVDMVFALNDVVVERRRQNERWGEQNHRSIAGMIGPGEYVRYDIPRADDAKRLCDARHRAGVGSWADIAIEELAEAVEAADKESQWDCRRELVQLAAVVLAWIECIDRNGWADEEEDEA